MGTWLRSGPLPLLQIVMPTLLLGCLDIQTFTVLRTDFFFTRGYPGRYIGAGLVEPIERSFIFQLIHHRYGHFRKGHPKGQR